MKTTIVREEIWKDEDLSQLHIDSKYFYFYILTSPDRGYLRVYKLNKRFASYITGMTEPQLDVAIRNLSDNGFIEIYEGYIAILKEHVAKVGGPYGAVNSTRELAKIPVDVREHFGLDDGDIIVIATAKKVAKKAGPAPETIKSIIARQPEAIRESLADLVEDRIERKKAPTTRAVKGWVSKLEKMYPNNPIKQAASIQQSIDRGWMGLFEVKSEDRTSESREFM